MIPSSIPILPRLFATLNACPSLDSAFSEKMLMETWRAFKQIALEQGDPLTPAVMAGLILYDKEHFAQLLDDAERAQMIALATLALERYRERTNNKLGKIIAASLKEL